MVNIIIFYYMKSLLTKLTLFSLALVLGGQFVFAQDAAEAPAVVSNEITAEEVQGLEELPTDVATVSEYTTSVEGVNFSKVSDLDYKVNFTLKNTGAPQSGIKYRVSLRPLNSEDGDEPYYSVTYPEIMAVGGGDTVSREVDFMVPDYMVGEYLVVVELGGEHGVIHALGSSRDTVTLTGEAVVVTPTGCYISVEGEDTKFNLTHGVDVETSERLFLNCLITNPNNDTLNIAPDFTTYVRNTWGEKITIEKIESKEISIEAGEEKLISIELPKADFPQAFDVVVSFSKAGGVTVAPVTAHYVIRGESATIHNVSISASEYAAGDTAQVLVSWSGSAEDFEGARNGGEIDENEQFFIDASLHNLNGESCAEITGQKLQQVTNGVTILDVPVTSACETIVAKIVIKNASGSVLTEKTYNFAATKKEVIGSVAEETSTTDNSIIIVVAAVALFLLLVLMMYLRGKHGDRGSVITSVALIVVGAFSAGSAIVYAGSYGSSTEIWSVADQGWSLHTATIAFAGPSGTYSNNQTITFLGNIAVASCANTRARSAFYVNVNGPTNRSYSRGADSFSFTIWAKDLANGNYTATSRWTDSGCQYIVGGSTATYPANRYRDHQCTRNPQVSESYSFRVANSPAGSVSAAGCTIADGASTCATVVNWNITNAPNPNLRNLTASYVYSWNSSGNAWQTMWYGNNTISARDNWTNLASVNVSATCVAGTIWSAGACRGVPVLTFTASPTPINPGTSSTLSWNVAGASSCTASGAWSGAKSFANGSYSEAVTPSVTSTYTLSCTGPGGSTVRSATVVVNPPVVTLSASPTLIGPGNSSTLSWTATGASSCTASGGWSGSKTNTGGSESVSPGITSSYSISCTGPSGTTPASATVTLPSGTISATACTIPVGGSSCSTNVTWAAQNFLSTPSILQGSSAFSSAASGSSVPRPANPDDRTFTMRDTGSSYSHSVDAAITCATNSVWAGTTCVQLPNISIVSNPNIVRSGNTAPIDISIEANYDLTCTLSGGLQETFTHSASATTRNYARTTPPLTSARVVHIECVHTVYPQVNAEDEVRVDVIPTVQEV